jgi:hypothetical protein
VLRFSYQKYKWSKLRKLQTKHALKMSEGIKKYIYIVSSRAVKKVKISDTYRSVSFGRREEIFLYISRLFLRSVLKPNKSVGGLTSIIYKLYSIFRSKVDEVVDGSPSVSFRIHVLYMSFRCENSLSSAYN